MTNNLSEGEASENLSIVLPLKKRELGSFITSLLGQQQSISRTQTVSFDIDHAWLVNLHEMINQRICQQANANLVDFVAVIHFDNGLNRRITTIDSFRGYIETKKEETIGIMLHWNYLIHFPNKGFPEKQEITFFARAKAEKDKEEANNSDFFYSLANAVTNKVQNSLVGYEISHTERTWGDDLESLISNEIDKIIRNENQIRKTIYNCFRWSLAFAVFIACTIYPVYYVINNSNADVFALLVEYQALKEAPSSIDVLGAKLDLIADIMHANANRGRGMFSIALSFFAPLLVFLTFKLTRRLQHSFFVLSKADAVRRETLLRKERNGVAIMIGAYIFAILAGIIGNYGYSFLNKIMRLTV
jgi:hypothetical protein